MLQILGLHKGELEVVEFEKLIEDTESSCRQEVFDTIEGTLRSVEKEVSFLERTKKP